MNCSQIRKLLDAHHDGELDAANTLLVDEHLADCPACFEQLRRLDVVRGAIKNANLRFAAPAGLRASVLSAVHRVAEAERPATPSRPWFSYAGWAAAAVLFVASAAVFFLSGPPQNERLVAEVTASHVRSLMATHLMDVASTDQHTVKPWFDGKLDFAPPVKDLRDLGFPLLGGRLDYIDGHPAAALVYGRQKHYLNLFIWPVRSSQPAPAGGPSPTPDRTVQLNGYNVIRWSDGRMDYAVVSDLNGAELHEFAIEWLNK